MVGGSRPLVANRSTWLDQVVGGYFWFFGRLFGRLKKRLSLKDFRRLWATKRLSLKETSRAPSRRNIGSLLSQNLEYPPGLAMLAEVREV